VTRAIRLGAAVLGCVLGLAFIQVDKALGSYPWLSLCVAAVAIVAVYIIVDEEGSTKQ
jgi:ABC-type Fe3+-siderophore transport system permease subunit